MATGNILTVHCDRTNPMEEGCPRACALKLRASAKELGDEDGLSCVA